MNNGPTPTSTSARTGTAGPSRNYLPVREEWLGRFREDVLEPDPSAAQITKLDPADVLTTAQAAQLLAPLIKPLPNFDQYVLGK